MLWRPDSLPTSGFPAKPGLGLFSRTFVCARPAGFCRESYGGPILWKAGALAGVLAGFSGDRGSCQMLWRAGVLANALESRGSCQCTGNRGSCQCSGDRGSLPMLWRPGFFPVLWRPGFPPEPLQAGVPSNRLQGIPDRMPGDRVLLPFPCFGLGSCPCSDQRGNPW